MLEIDLALNVSWQRNKLCVYYVSATQSYIDYVDILVKYLIIY